MGIAEKKSLESEQRDIGIRQAQEEGQKSLYNRKGGTRYMLRRHQELEPAASQACTQIREHTRASEVLAAWVSHWLRHM